MARTLAPAPARRRPARRDDRPLRRLAGLAAGTAAALAAALLPHVPAQAAAPTYVALGDSYSSGTGTRTYLADGTSCQRSTAAFPSLIAASKGYALNFRACSGAKIRDVVNSQLGALSTATNYVSISVGGNDAGFADVLTTCALPSWASNCGGAINTAQSYIANTLPAALGSLYAGIRSRAPHAKVVVVGYPRIFMGEDCNAFTWFSPTEQSRLNQTADQLNARLAAAASAAGFTFADPTSRFLGHAVCDSPEWINGLSSPVSESYHPNVAGHGSGYTPAVSGLLTGATVAADAALLATAAEQSETLASTQRQYADADRTIEPKEFLLPDMGSPAVKRAARRAGVDLEAFLARG